MPEGDTIFRAARTLNRALAGQRVTRFESAYAQLTRADEDTSIVGRTIAGVESRGKHLLVRFSGDLVLRTHMRMSGSWHIYRPGESWQRPRHEMRVLVATEQFVAVGFNIPVAEMETTHTLQRAEVLGSLGPDLLSPAFDPSEALRRMRARPTEQIAEVLLNQRVLAGIGNIFKSETLFLCQIDPFAPIADLSDEQLTTLIATARRLLADNVRATSGDGIVTRPSLRRAHPSERLWVYGRHDKPCRRCGIPVSSRQHGLDSRRTYWCDTCQPGQEAEERRSDGE